MIAAFPDFRATHRKTFCNFRSNFVLDLIINFSTGSILSIVSIVGILFHEEFYVFIIVSSLLPLIFNIREKNS